MMENQADLLHYDNASLLRRKLLPWWIKTFIWLFLAIGFVGVPIALIFGVMNYSFQIALYGLETSDPISFLGMSLIAIFLFKGWVSFSLRTGRDNAVQLGIVDAILGIGICLFVMIGYPFLISSVDVQPNFRLELIFIIPYLLFLFKIRKPWQEIGASDNE